MIDPRIPPRRPIPGRPAETLEAAVRSQDVALARRRSLDAQQREFRRPQASSGANRTRPAA